MIRALLTMIFAGLTTAATAQTLLTLDSCRAMALRNNKTLAVSQMQRRVAGDMKKSARTKFLPRIDAAGAYTHTTRSMSALSDEQQQVFSNLGVFSMGQQQLGAMLNMLGEGIVDAFYTDTRNVLMGSVTVTQPIFMGGGIVAMSRMAALNERMAENTAEAKRQATIYDIDKAYWTVVSLAHKKRLAESYLQLVKKLDTDVDKMIREGVATRAEGLSVKVKVNEAEMTLMQVDNGLSLSRMLLCQLCGLPLDGVPMLAEENSDSLDVELTETLTDVAAAVENRPEVRALGNAVDISRQTVNLMRAGYMPKVMLTGGYTFSNPSMFNGFNRKMAGMWNVGVAVHIPVWNWGDVAYKVRAAKGAAAIAKLEMEETKEKITLQINQSAFKLSEARKRLLLAGQSVARAEENMRCANIGFSEGVIPSTTVMEAQTAWLQAKSQKIDAQVGVKLCQTDLRKSAGRL